MREFRGVVKSLSSVSGIRSAMSAEVKEVGQRTALGH